MTPLFAGSGLGFLVAAQVGPVWLLAARSVILGRLITGIVIGLGAATTDVAYGTVGLAGAASLLRIPGLRLGLGLLGAAVLTALGALALRHATRAGDQAEPSKRLSSAPRAYLTALGATAANPLTITSWAAIFAAASTARITHTTAGAVLLLAGIALGTAGWFTVLSTAMALVRRLAGQRLYQVIHVISGLGLIAFGIVLAWQTATAASPQPPHGRPVTTTDIRARMPNPIFALSTPSGLPPHATAAGRRAAPCRRRTQPTPAQPKEDK